MTEVLVLIVVLASIWSIGYFSSHALSLAVGDSMAPTFEGCTLVSIDQAFLAQDLQPGDIAVVDIPKQSNGFDRIVHRVVENRVGQEEFSTRGDNDFYYQFPSSIDGFFDYSAFQGKAEYFVNLPQEYCENTNGGEIQ